MIPPKMPQIAQSSLDPSVPERGRFGKGPAGAAALAAFMAFIALAFIAFIGKGAAGAAALAAFMAFIAMRDGPAPRVKRAAETEVTPPMRETSIMVVHNRLELVHLNRNGDGDEVYDDEEDGDHGHGLIWLAAALLGSEAERDRGECKCPERGRDEARRQEEEEAD